DGNILPFICLKATFRSGSAMEKPMGLPFTVRIKIREGSAIYVKSFAMCKNSSLVMGINPQLFSQEVL
ncbi:MAG: hypothetical protein DRG73_07800, partial [Deltaproteobacteria bacterium]